MHDGVEEREHLGAVLGVSALIREVHRVGGSRSRGVHAAPGLTQGDILRGERRVVEEVRPADCLLMQQLAEPADKPDLAVRDSLVQHLVVALGDAVSIPFSDTCLYPVQCGRAVDVRAGVTVRDILLLHVSEESSAVHLVDILGVAALVPALLVVGDIH